MINYYEEYYRHIREKSLNESASGEFEAQKQIALAAMARWTEGWKKLSEIEPQFEKYIRDHPGIKGGICEFVWHYLINFFMDPQLAKTNGLVAELHEILLSTQTWVLSSISKDKDNLKANMQRLVSSLYGHVNALYANIKKGNYVEAEKAAGIIYDGFMKKPGFLGLEGEYNTIFNSDAKTRMASFRNMLKSPLVGQSATATPATPATSGSAATSTKPRARAAQPDADMSKIKANVSKLID